MVSLRKVVVCTAVLCAMAAASASQVVPRNRIAKPIESSQMVRLQGNVSPLTQVGMDLGRVNGTTRLNNVMLVFKHSAEQKAAIQTLIEQQRDPSSPNYHKWLTPEEYAERFGMSPDDLNTVSDWLKSRGFSVNRISRDRTRLFFSGTVAQVESVFRTEFHRYQLKGETHLANSAEPAIPAALSGTVSGFQRLNDFQWRPQTVPRGVRPKFTAGTDTFLAPADVATIYNVNPLYAAGFDGDGQRIAVVGQTSIKVSDVSAFRAAGGLPPNPPVLFLVPGGSSILNTADEVEADLDVEWAGAIAKKATVVYVYTDQSQSQGGVIGAFEYAIDQNLAPVVSISYGACEASNGQAFITFLQGLMQEADLHGQTVSSSIGDAGATDCEPATKNATIATTGLAVDVPGAIPDVTAVGGTRFTSDDNHNPTFWNATNDPLTNGSALQYIPETTWNDGFNSATGGGVSSIIAKPAFQTTLTPADGHRDVPDIALNASPDHDPYLVCDASKASGATCTSGFGNALLVGGTSAGAPVFASMLTLINQATENSGGQGSINPVLYTLASSPSTYAMAFHDIASGNNKQACQVGSTGCTNSPIGFTAGTGYDLTTGLGSIDLDNLVKAWPGFTLSPKYDLVANTSPVVINTPGSSGSSILTVSGNGGFTGTVTVKCLVLAASAEMTCAVNPSTINLSGTTASGTATLTVSTTAPHAVAFVPGLPAGSPRIAFWALFICASVMLVHAMRRHRRGLVATFATLMIGITVACGGGSSSTGNNNGGGTTTDPGTPIGSYVVAVTTTTGSVSHTINVPVKVN